MLLGFDNAFVHFEWWMLLYGTAAHLWFLPFIFVAGLAARALHGLTWRLPTWLVSWPLLAIAVLGLLIEPFGPYPIPTWWMSWPCIPLGVVLGRWSGQGYLQRWWATPVTLAVGAIGAIYIAQSGLAIATGRFAVAAALIVLALRFPGRPAWDTRTLPPLVYGIFLVHIIALMLLRDVLPDGPSPELLAVAAFTASAAITWLMQRTRLRALV